MHFYLVEISSLEVLSVKRIVKWKPGTEWGDKTKEEMLKEATGYFEKDAMENVGETLAQLGWRVMGKEEFEMELVKSYMIRD